jgi:pyruvate kinase
MPTFTKIIATIGPASQDPKTLRELQQAGMNAARINLSHGDRQSQVEYIRRLRQLDDNLAIILDTKGPEIRTGSMAADPTPFSSGQKVLLTAAAIEGTPEAIPIVYPHLDEIPLNAQILFDDGLVESTVVEKTGDDLIVQMLSSGPIGSRKKVTVQGYRAKLPFLTEDDRNDIAFAIDNGIRLIAASFVRSGRDVRELRAFIEQTDACIQVFSKIEHPDAVDNLGDILEASDGIMVARGDLGVELPLQEVPGIQEKIIRLCNQAGKPVIVATQMLESMRSNPRPTRAEVSDIANAILQGTDAIMLSAETATGRYPVRAVQMMCKIARQYELQVNSVIEKYRRNTTGDRNEIAQFIAKAAFYASTDLDVSAILTPTESGFTARNVSRFKPKCPIYASAKNPAVLQFLQLVWGVVPLMDRHADTDRTHYEMAYTLVQQCYDTGLLSKDDRIIITSGSRLITKRGTNLLEIYNVSDIIDDNVSR